MEEEEPPPAPYTAFLERMVGKMPELRSAPNLEVELINRGVVGELTDDMLARLDRDVLGPRPDAVIILGGSNDLGWGLEPETIVENLAQMTDGALVCGIQPVACTVPSVLGFDAGIQPRLRLNELVKKRSADRGVACVDLFSATSDSAGRLREDYSNDGLHLSTAGYKAVADAIFSGAVSGIVLDRLRCVRNPRSITASGRLQSAF